MDLPMQLKQRIEAMAAKVTAAQLSQAAAALSLRYREESGQGKRLLTKEEEALAYAIVRMPATYGAVYRALELILPCCSGEVRSVLDVGAGTGAACYAAQALLPTTAAYTCLEREQAMVQLGKTLMEGQEELCDALWLIKDMNASFEAHADLVTASYALNELTDAAREAMVARLWEAADQTLLLVEPGTPAGFAQLRKARAQLLALGAAVAAPCPHGEDCPMAEGDWCHFTVRVSRSRLHKQLKGGEAPYEDEKFCFLAATKLPAERAAGRVLRHPNIQPGSIGLTLCTAAGECSSIKVTKKQGAAFKAARKADAGDSWTF